ncbi:hypothetical protein T440DRAFT_535978 [Plenodomus tracheiphilus IPT5]|uniref:Uncharacterized protein n=1 Tax=Plenodomus tracheiphilus IPT5 TaxID=1408161 RepID=A0A6A7BK00_9PLEO|nr:hypothetical protein T440DRAFT_535978 [Plenodomus tracheiphilus IPT5]
MTRLMLAKFRRFFWPRVPQRMYTSREDWPFCSICLGSSHKLRHRLLLGSPELAQRQGSIESSEASDLEPPGLTIGSNGPRSGNLGDGNQLSWKVWKDVVEAVSNFMFLWTGLMNYVQCHDDYDILGNLRITCLDFKNNCGAGVLRRFRRWSCLVWTSSSFQQFMRCRSSGVIPWRFLFSVGGSLGTLVTQLSVEEQRANDWISKHEPDLHTLQEKFCTLKENYKSTKAKLKKKKERGRTAEVYLGTSATETSRSKL